MIDRIGKNVGAQLISLAVSFVDRIILVGVLLRSWGADAFSDWSVLLSTAGLLSLGELGLNIYYGNALEKARSGGESPGMKRIVSVALAVSFLVALFLGATGLLLLSFWDLPRLLEVGTFQHREAEIVLAILGGVTLSRLSRGAISQIYRGHGQFALGIIVDLGASIASLIFVFSAVLAGAGPVIAACLYFAGDILGGWGLMLFDLKRRWPDLRFVPELPSRAEFADITRKVKWLAIQQGAPVAWLQMPIVMLGYFGVAGPQLVSFITQRTLVNFSRTLGSFMALGSGVEIAALRHSGKHVEIERYLTATGRILSVMAAGIAVGLFTFGKPLISVWTGHPDLFDPGIAAALLASAVLSAPIAPLAAHLMYSNAPRPASVSLIVQLVLGLGMSALLIPRYGALGAAVSLGAAEAIAQAVVLPIAGNKQLGVNYWRYGAQCSFAMLCAGLWCWAVARLALILFDAGSWTGLLFMGVFWLAAGFAPSLVLVIPGRYRVLLKERAQLAVAGKPRLPKFASKL